MGDTEKAVYRKDAQAKRDRKLKQNKPLYFDDDEAEKADAEDDNYDYDDDEDEEAAERAYELARSLATDVKMRQPFSDPNAFSFDKRLQLDHLSEGRWILRRAGYPDPGDTEPHEIADPEKYKDFRVLLARLAGGEDMDKDQLSELTLEANKIVKELATLAIAICMTPDVVSQTRAHRLQSPFAVLHDEAGKTPEIDTVAGLIFSRPYEEGSGPLQIVADSYCPHVLFSDIFQPTPVLGRQAQYHPFGKQTSVSLFQRWVLGGLDTVWLWEQHRSNSDIIDLVNYILPRGRMQVAPNVDN
jgi:hypothetical protein